MNKIDHDSTDCKVLSTDANVAVNTSKFKVVEYLEMQLQYMKST